MFRDTKKLHTTSLPVPVNTGIGNDERRDVAEYKEKLTAGEFLSKIDFDLAGRSAILCDYDFSRDKMLLRQLVGYLRGAPRVLICSESQLRNLDFFQQIFPAGIVSGGQSPIKNGIYVLPADQPVQSLKNLLESYAIYPVIHMSRLTLDRSCLNLLTSLGTGYMLLVDKDPSAMVEEAGDQRRLFSVDYILAAGYPGAALEYTANCLWTYEKQVSSQMVSYTPGAEYNPDSLSFMEMNRLDEVPVLRKFELQKLEQEGKFLIADRLKHRCMVGRIFEEEKQKRSIFQRLLARI